LGGGLLVTMQLIHTGESTKFEKHEHFEPQLGNKGHK